MRFLFQILIIICFLAGVTSVVYACFLLGKISGFFALGLALLGITAVLENNLDRR